MPNGQDHGILTIVAVQHNVAAGPKVNQPLAKLRLHVFCRPADTGLLGHDFHSVTNSPNRSFGGINVIFSKESVESL